MATSRKPSPRPSPSEGKGGHSKVALVTGGARRVGRAVALALAGAGYDVAITYRASRAAAQEVVRAIAALGRRAAALRVDLARLDAAEVVHRAFVRRFPRLDALVNNAACFDPTPLGQIRPRDFDRQLAVNARAPLLLIQKFAPLLAAHARPADPASLGRVVNFLDMHALGRPMRGYAAYNASKAALWQITLSLARELAPRVTVNGIAPGVIDWAPSFTPAQRRAYLQRVPLARAGTPADAAAAVLFLVRDAHYTTGEVLRLDGGRWLA